jgi:hypothetical protein
MYISRHVRFHEHVFSFDKSEQIAKVSAQTHTPSLVTILSNLTHSPLFTDHTTPHLASTSALPSPPTQTPQPPPFLCRSPHASLSHHVVAGTGCKSVFPALQHDVFPSTGTPSSSSSASPYSASHPVSADSVFAVSPVVAASPLLAAASSPASSSGLNLVVDLSAYPLHQNTSMTPTSPASPSLLSRHPMVLRSLQPKTANMVSSAATDTAATRVLLSPSSEPVAFSNANKYVVWHDAMCDEIKVLRSNHTWSLVPFHPSMNVVGSRWVYHIKRRIDGSIERCKARLVARGFTQQEGIDYSEFSAQLLNRATVRLVFSIVVSRHWKIHQLDIHNVFLNGVLTKKVYMKQPPSFVDPTLPSHVCRLHKSLYGLKQAPKAWYTCLSDFLLSIGFRAFLFILSDGTNIFYLLVYVDDILLTGSNSAMLHRLIQLLSSKFKLRDLDDVHYFLGIEVQFTGMGLMLRQHKYILDILTRACMTSCKPVDTLVSPSKLVI